MAADLEERLRGLKLSVVTKTKEEPIGVGSYASVYEVIVHETVCAAKVMHPILCEAIGSEIKRRAFLRECEQSSRLLHPNVVQFFGIYYPSPDAKLPWLVMELMYISLTNLIEKYETTDFSITFKLSMLIGTCQGLQFLHNQNIIHRDLSSNNILLTKHLVAKIADLGMAKIITPGLQRHTQAPGTIAFMPPEALSSNPTYGFSIDIFSVGCVCVHMISMQWPLPLDKICDKVILSEVERRKPYFTNFSNLIKISPLKLLVERCLQDKPDHRPDIEEVCKSLKIIDRDHHLPEHDYDIIELTESVASHQQKLAEYERLITQKDEQLIEKNECLRIKDQLISQKDQLISQKDQELVQNKLLLNEQLLQKDEHLKQKDKQLTQKNKALFQKDQILRQKNNGLKQKYEELVQNKLLLNEKDEQLTQKDKALFQKDQMLRQKNNELKQKYEELVQNKLLLNEQLLQKDDRLKQKDKQLTQKDKALFQKDQILRQKNNELKQKYEEILMIKRSHQLERGQQLNIFVFTLNVASGLCSGVARLSVMVGHMILHIHLRLAK